MPNSADTGKVAGWQDPQQGDFAKPDCEENCERPAARQPNIVPAARGRKAPLFAGSSARQHIRRDDTSADPADRADLAQRTSRRSRLALRSELLYLRDRGRAAVVVISGGRPSRRHHKRDRKFARLSAGANRIRTFSPALRKGLLRERATWIPGHLPARAAPSPERDHETLWGGRRGNGNFVAACNRWSAAMPHREIVLRFNLFNRSLLPHFHGFVLRC